MKNNKTKPIKKLLIFTIITVMIASLFALPAFAKVSDTVGWKPVSSTKIAPIEFMVSQTGYSDPINTNGMYKITVNVASIVSTAGAIAGENHSGSSYTMFIFGTYAQNEGAYTYGYTYIMTNTADEYYYHNDIDGSNDLYSVTLKYTGGAETTELIVPYQNTTRSYRLDNYQAPMEIAFIVPYYPFNNPDSTDAEYFWNNVTYTVEQYGTNDTPTDPDPEEPTDPDTPTPPADGEEQGIFAVWSKITQWIVQGLASVSNAFYADGKLTLLGTLCIIPLALGLAFLLIGIIQKFLRLRG